MLRRAKLLTLGALDRLGVSALLAGSEWRRRRLLILCYHGVSLEDEHLWAPVLYMDPGLFRQRLSVLRELGAAVMPLAEALDRLCAGTLPPRAVVLTFDDGTYDFYRTAYPILKEFGYPATVYLTTYYSEFQRPVFDVACSYLLWKAAGRRLNWPELFERPVFLDEAAQAGARQVISAHARQAGLSARRKDDLLAALAARLSIDYETLCRKRILHLMTPAEAGELARAGVDFQLHTHRHRISMNRDWFAREIEDNRRRLGAISGRPAHHFCYPGGVHRPEFPGWLRGWGVESATTCDPGLASPGTNPWLLPRLVDTTGLTPVEFRSWIGGVASLLPHRAYAAAEDQFLEAVQR